MPTFYTCVIGHVTNDMHINAVSVSTILADPQCRVDYM